MRRILQSEPNSQQHSIHLANTTPTLSPHWIHRIDSVHMLQSQHTWTLDWEAVEQKPCSKSVMVMVKVFVVGTCHFSTPFKIYSYRSKVANVKFSRKFRKSAWLEPNDLDFSGYYPQPNLASASAWWIVHRKSYIEEPLTRLNWKKLR